MKDQNYLLNLEKAIIEKYGEKTVRNPKSNWNKDKEQKYLEQLQELNKKEETNHQQIDIVDIHGVLSPSKLIIKEINKVCTICKHYSFLKRDDVYLNKYNTCFKCFIEHIEGREDKWKNKIYHKKN